MTLKRESLSKHAASKYNISVWNNKRTISQYYHDIDNNDSALFQMENVTLPCKIKKTSSQSNEVTIL